MINSVTAEVFVDFMFPVTNLFSFSALNNPVNNPACLVLFQQGTSHIFVNRTYKALLLFSFATSN